MNRRRGFTLLELMAVVSILAIVVSLAVPIYGVYIERARESEALVQVPTIAILENVRILELGEPITCEPNPPQLPGATPQTFLATESWSDLGLRIEAPVRFRYRVDRRGEQGFFITAEGDVNGDGAITRMTMSSDDLLLRVERGVTE